MHTWQRRLAGVALVLLGASLSTGRALAGRVPFADRLTIATVGSYGHDYAVPADVDGDGDLDVVSEIRSELLWHENPGGSSSGLWTWHRIGSANGAYELVVADVDGDGDVDVVGAEEERLSWFENDDGVGLSWRRHAVSPDFPAGGAPVYAADVDADGDVDVVAGTISPGEDRVSWFENTRGDGSDWRERAIATEPTAVYAVFVADLDRDGTRDVIVGSDDAVRWYANAAGDGSRWSSSVLIEGIRGHVTCVSAADLDGDGDVDVLAASVFDDASWWFENPGTSVASWSAHPIPAGAHPRWLAPWDLDGDGDLDVVSASEGDAWSIEWHENVDGNLTDTSHGISFALLIANQVAVADIDGDGDPDVLSADTDGVIGLHDNLTIHRSALFPTRPSITRSADVARAVEAADVDGDGDLDVLSASSGDDKAAWYENESGDGSSWSERPVTTRADGASSLAVEDVDGDGDPDVVVGSARDGGVRVYFNIDGAGSFNELASHTITTAAAEASSVEVVDLDRDGDLDVLAAWLAGVSWYRNPGLPATPWTSHFLWPLDGATAALPGDFDRDGDPDVVAVSPKERAVRWYENRLANPFPPWIAHDIATGSGAPRTVFVADIDGDGDLDVLSGGGDEIRWHENRWPDAWATGIATTQAYGVNAVAAFDLDADGDLDLLSASQDDERIAWYENLGGRWVQRPISDRAGGASAVSAADLDHDGDLDVLAAEAADDQISWFPNRGGQVALEGADTAPPVLLEGASDDVLRITVVHRGRAGDTDLELRRLELRFEDEHGSPLFREQADALIEFLVIYRDDGSGVWESAFDELLVAEQRPFLLVNGRYTVELGGDRPSVRVGVSDSRTLFVVLRLGDDAADASPDSFRLVHLPLEAVALDPTFSTPVFYSTPLAVEHAETQVSGVVRAVSDDDGDGWFDHEDNCPERWNPSQADGDGDGVGDLCDNCPDDGNAGQADDDGDGAGDVCDNCPGLGNPDQVDADADHVGDACDNCPERSNPEQENQDADGLGDACDNCRFTANPDQENHDSDPWGDACDNCPRDHNPLQQDADSDGHGDACDNCPERSNRGQENRDRDAWGDLCDNCILDPNDDQRDTNGDAFGNVCDPDYNDDGAVGIPDFNHLRGQFGLTSDDKRFDPDVDANGDGAIGLPDFNVLRRFFGGPPGPSGVAPDCPFPPCPTP
ncbi:MAG: FG-GAP-like repeat-containing protein [Myxococcota bacterium]|nr:FG-GAP-like repeat-containing protein [Myxococcota bacterium]